MRSSKAAAAALPLLAIEPVPVDDPALQAAWAALPATRLVMFVSPNAVASFMAGRPTGWIWPDGLLAGATGPGTVAALRAARNADGSLRYGLPTAVSLLIFLPMATPEVVLGAGLASQFFSIGAAKGIATIIIAHVMFCMSFVVVTVKARVASLDPALEEAGRDLYGSPAQVFWKITFPLLMPGILSAALLSFALSFDDFIITNFNSGPAMTFPKYVYTAAARGIPAEANVIGSGVFLLAIAIVVTVQIRGSLKARRLARQQ